MGLLNRISAVARENTLGPRRCRTPRASPALLLALLGTLPLPAQPLLLPTANRALFEPGGQERFYVGTAGKTWLSGTFGCVRTQGRQMHEGIDIRALERDRRGEPTDAVSAIADGVVAYVNAKASLSNYGIYVVLRHQRDGIEFYSWYAHLSEVRDGLAPGLPLRAGEVFARLGRTANTVQPISKDRAHLHLEVNLLVNDAFPTWHHQTSGGVRNDHGLWNGRNFLALDPSLILLSSHRFGTNFNLQRFVRNQPALCRVLVRVPDFPWVHRYACLVEPSALPPHAVAGFELHLEFNGVPVRLIPRDASAFRTTARYELLDVNETLQRECACRRLVQRKGDSWGLARTGVQLLDLLTFRP